MSFSAVFTTLMSSISMTVASRTTANVLRWEERIVGFLSTSEGARAPGGF